MADASQLQVQEGVLPRIHVHGQDLLGTGQGIVQGVAASRGNDQHGVVGREFHRFVVEPGIFPAGVIDQVVPVDQFEDLTARPFANRHGYSPCIVFPYYARKEVNRY